MTIGIALRLVLAMGLWAACFPLITIGLSLAPHLAFAAMRAALAALSLLMLGALFRRPMPRCGYTWSLIALVGLGATTLGFLAMFHAAEFVSPGIATVIANAQPLLAAMLAHAFLGERLRGVGTAGLVTGLAGVTVMAGPGFFSAGASGYALGIGYASLAAAGEAVGRVAMKRLPEHTDAIMAMGLQLLLGAAPLALLSANSDDLSSVTWSGKFVAILGVLAVFGTAVPFWLWFSALKHIDLNRANAFTFLIPLFGLAIGAAFFQERLGWTQVVGAVLILAGIALVERGTLGRATRN